MWMNQESVLMNQKVSGINEDTGRKIWSIWVQSYVLTSFNRSEARLSTLIRPRVILKSYCAEILYCSAINHIEAAPSAILKICLTTTLMLSFALQYLWKFPETYTLQHENTVELQTSEYGHEWRWGYGYGYCFYFPTRYVPNPNQIRGFGLEPIRIRSEPCLTRFGFDRISIPIDSDSDSFGSHRIRIRSDLTGFGFVRISPDSDSTRFVIFKCGKMR